MHVGLAAFSIALRWAHKGFLNLLLGGLPGFITKSNCWDVVWLGPIQVSCVVSQIL